MIYVTSDLHGYPLDKFKILLNKANFSNRDYCFILGDVIDRGLESVKLMKWLIKQSNIKLILGNHEVMFLACTFLFDAITDETIEKLTTDQMEVFSTWIANGGRSTLKEISNSEPKEVRAIVDYLRNAPLYDTVSLNNRDFLLVHSGLGRFEQKKKIDEYTADELIWTRPQITQKYFSDVITILGHTPTHFYGPQHRGKAIFTPTWINIDTGAAYGGSPMILRLDDMKEFYISS